MKRYISIGISVALFISCFVLSDAFAQKALYDDFSGTYINYQRWNEGEWVREIVAGKLVSKVRNGPTNTRARNNTAFQTPSLISVIQCDITVVETSLDTGTAPMSFARVSGRFYNTLNSGTERGDIWTGLYIGDRGSGLEAWWEVYESSDDEGNSWEEKGSSTFVVPGLAYGNSYTAKIEYDGANGFTFSVAGVSDSFTGPARQGAGFTAYKALETGAYSDGGSGAGYTSALFDNVYINNQGTAYDTFDSAPLDQSKWSSQEMVRDISAGKLRLLRQGYPNGWIGMGSTLVFSDADYLEAKVLVESGSQLSSGASAIARIGGDYYNDTFGPGSGQDYNQREGNIFAHMGLRLDENNNLVAVVEVSRSNAADHSSSTNIFYESFVTPINFDTEYVLSIEFTGSEFIFKCNDQTLNYKITTPAYEPYNEARYLHARIWLDPGESGYLKASFDDVYVERVVQSLPAIPLLLLDG